MQSAEATYPAATAVPVPARQLHPTSNTLILVADTGLALRQVQQALLQAGVAPVEIELLSGRAGLDQLALPSPRRDLPALLGRWLRMLGPDTLLMERYRRELAHGHALVVVRGMPRAVAEHVGERLVGAGGRCLRHYGRFSVSFLAA